MSSWGFTTYQLSSCTYWSHGYIHGGSYSLMGSVDLPQDFSCNLPPEFLRVLVFRIVSPIGRYTYARRDTCRFLLSLRYLNQQWILEFLISQCPKGTLVYWILWGHQHTLHLGNYTNVQLYLVYLTNGERRMKFLH